MYLGREAHDVIRRLKEPEMEARTAQTMKSLSVTTIRSIRQQVASLSGGQRQSVAIGRAVMWNSRLVILDEPTAALGVAQTRQVLDLVRRLATRVSRSSSSRTTCTTSSRSRTASPCSASVATSAIFDRRATTQQEVVHAITAGVPTKVAGIAGTGRRRSVSVRTQRPSPAEAPAPEGQQPRRPSSAAA